MLVNYQKLDFLLTELNCLIKIMSYIFFIIALQLFISRARLPLYFFPFGWFC